MMGNNFQKTLSGTPLSISEIPSSPFGPKVREPQRRRASWHQILGAVAAERTRGLAEGPRCKRGRGLWASRGLFDEKPEQYKLNFNHACIYPNCIFHYFPCFRMATPWIHWLTTWAKNWMSLTWQWSLARVPRPKRPNDIIKCWRHERAEFWQCHVGPVHGG